MIKGKLPNTLLPIYLQSLAVECPQRKVVGIVGGPSDPVVLDLVRDLPKRQPHISIGLI
jgi:hypothetical protein